jgi:hypothetical protein
MRLTSIENKTTSALKRGSRRPTFCEEQNLTTSFQGPSDKKRNFSIDFEAKVRKCSMSIFSSENPHPQLQPRSPKSHRNSLLLCSGLERKTSLFFPAPAIEKLNFYEPSDFESSEEEEIEYDFAEEPEKEEPIRESQASVESLGGNQEIKKLFHHMFGLWFYMFLLITRFLRFLCAATRGLVKRIVGSVKTQTDINRHTVVDLGSKPETAQTSQPYLAPSNFPMAIKGKQKSMHHKQAEKHPKPRLTRKISYFASPNPHNSSPEIARQRSSSCFPAVNNRSPDKSTHLSHLKQSDDICQVNPTLGQRVKDHEQQSQIDATTHQKQQSRTPAFYRLETCFEAAKFIEATISHRHRTFFPLNHHYQSRAHDF